MRKKNLPLLVIIFWIVAVADIAGIAAGYTTLHFITKPLLMPLLIVWVAISQNPISGKALIVTGLFFSWFGDIFLLFENRNQFFFITGLVCFLTTHIFYSIYFLKINSTKPSLLRKQPLFVILVVVYGFSLVWFLFPFLNNLKIPVIIYAAVICNMLLCSLHVFFKAAPPANLLYVTGAIFFVCSDSVLAINKFYSPFAAAPALIMLTYCAAQFFIVKGYINHHYYEQD